MQSLQNAVMSGDMAELRAAIRQGQAAGLPADSMATAMEKLAELEEAESRKQQQEAERQRELERQAMLEQARRDHAAEMLAEACKSRDVSSLRAAIDAAHKAGLDGHELEQASKVLAEEEAKAAARSLLESAAASDDVERLREALRRGEMAKLEEAELEACRQALAQAEARARARQSLRKALADTEEAEGGRLEVLEAALKAGQETGLGGDGNEADASLMATARQRADEEAAKAQLKAAIALEDAEELRRAIDFAQRTGFTGQALEDAESLLRALLAREAAKKELKDACQSADLDRLQAALESAEHEGLADEEKSEALEKLRELQRRATAARRLKDAMESGEVHALRAALHEGAEAGVAPEDMEAGKAALAQSEERAQLRRALQAAQHAPSQAPASPEAPAAAAATTPEPERAPRAPATSDIRPPSTAGEQMVQTLDASTGARSARCTPTSQTRLFEKSEYMFKKTVLGSDLSDEEVMKTLRQRLRKLCVSPAEALSECMQMPAVANAGNGDGNSSLPPVDADVVAAFAEQLQLSIDQPRTLKLLSGLGDGAGDGTTVSVSEFLNALQGSAGSQGQGASRREAQPAGGGPGDTIKMGSGALTGAHAAAAAREERKRELMQQSKPKEHLGCAACRCV